MSTVLVFVADEIAATPLDDEGVAWVFLADKQSRSAGASHYLTMSRMLDDDDGYHIERDDQGWGGYGGVAAVVLDADLLHVQLTDSGTRTLGGVREIRVSVGGHPSPLLRGLRTALEAIFAGTSLFVQAPE